VSQGKLDQFKTLMPELVQAIELPDDHAGDSHFRHAVLTSELFNAVGVMIDKDVRCDMDTAGNLVESSKTPHCVYAKAVEYLRAQLGVGKSK
jgi:hypothetical protein